jgi:hypothetical protein
VIKSIALKCRTCIIGAVRHYTKPLKPASYSNAVFWTAQSQFYADVGRFEPTFVAMLQSARVSAARTIHYWLPLYLRVRKPHTHEYMAMESELAPTAKSVGGVLT